MPEIARFLGIVIGMFYSEHGLPHLHAVYGEFKMTVELGKNCSATGPVRGSVNPCIGSLRWSSSMNYDVIEARYLSGFVVWLKFRDGTAGEIDLSSELTGPVFEPLRDPSVFRQFEIHPEFHTLVWPNGADLAPEFLHDNVRVTA